MTATLLLLLLACGGGETAPHGHDHDGDHAHDHDADHGHDGDAAHADDHDDGHAHGADGGEAASVDPVEVMLGDSKGTLTPSEGALTLSVVDAAGAAVAPEGEVRLVLTPTGGAEQRLVLVPDGAHWKGSALATGAVGYTAVMTVPIGGSTQSGKATWGTVAAAKSAPAPHDHGDEAHEHEGEDHGHAH